MPEIFALIGDTYHKLLDAETRLYWYPVFTSAGQNRLKTSVAALMVLASTYTVEAGQPFFRNSIVSNDIDFIHAADPIVESTLKYVGTSRSEMPDKRNDRLFDDKSHVFAMEFADSTTVKIFLHSDFDDFDEVERYSKLLQGPLGKLPLEMRETLSHVVVHKGNDVAFSEHLGHFFVLYSQNMETRLKNNDLEETVFHESVHATLDHRFRESADWIEAQKADGMFVTNYGADNPDSEDFAESALFAYTLNAYPNRLPADLQIWLRGNIPNRIAYFDDLFKQLD